MVIVSIDEGNVQGWRKPCSTAVFPKAGDALQSPRDLKKKDRCLGPSPVQREVHRWSPGRAACSLAAPLRLGVRMRRPAPGSQMQILTPGPRHF